jgi:hypothetical protein
MDEYERAAPSEAPASKAEVGEVDEAQAAEVSEAEVGEVDEAQAGN